VIEVTEGMKDTRALREHLVFLRDATARIGESSCLDETVRRLGRAFVPLLADSATVHLLDRLFAANNQGAVDPCARPPASQLVRCAEMIHQAEPGRWAEDVPDGEVQILSPSSPGARAMASGQPFVVGNVGPEAAAEMAGCRRAGGTEPGGHGGSLLAIPLMAGGRALGCATLQRDPARQPFDDIDVLTTSVLAAQASQSIDSVCGYRGQAATAAALHQSMLPAHPPRLAGVEIAHRYLPGGKDTQVGGDWFDAIALPGGRVALVVGDVMGHGIGSAAIMGRLRTSVQTLAALDLPPEQVLRHLDDIARRLDDDHLATCVYAVYDPVARSCVVANAGHIPPVLVHCGGQAELLTSLPAGAPIGVGGVPFEPMEVQTADGDLLVLCTDGLVEMRGQDIGSGLAALCESVAAPGVTPDELCEILMRTLHTRDREDDVALLIARLHGIPSSDVAQWLLHPWPTAPGVMRQTVRRTLHDWGLSACSDVAELLVSELATNAVRYASRPIELRLMRTDVLLCEIKDDDHHLPVLRSASETDEFGRGLKLVSSLARRWGANRTSDGKVVWFDLALPRSAH
jgi:anti-sigma regulatory factor (Ser/Thr protein kinase)/GAF domain-containing protein